MEDIPSRESQLCFSVLKELDLNLEQSLKVKNFRIETVAETSSTSHHEDVANEDSKVKTSDWRKHASFIRLVL